MNDLSVRYVTSSRNASHLTVIDHNKYSLWGFSASLPLTPTIQTLRRNGTNKNKPARPQTRPVHNISSEKTFPSLPQRKLHILIPSLALFLPLFCLALETQPDKGAEYSSGKMWKLLTLCVVCCLGE